MTALLSSVSFLVYLASNIRRYRYNLMHVIIRVSNGCNVTLL